MNQGSYLINNNFRGLLVSQRPIELQAMQINRLNPFISRVTNKEPLGLPPIKKSLLCDSIKKPQNYVELKNKEIVKKIQKLKKLERDIISEEDLHIKKKFGKLKEKLDKQNFNINEIRRELYDYPSNTATGNFMKNNKNNKTSTNGFGLCKTKIESTNFYQLNEDYHNFFSKDRKKGESIHDNYSKIEDKPKEDIRQIEQNINIDEGENVHAQNIIDGIDLNDENNKDEIQNLINFANNLDYDKYIRDLEIREALYLIKNKIEKDKLNENKNAEEISEIKEDTKPNKVNSFPEEQNNLNELLNKNVNANSNPVVHDKEWDNSVKPVEGVNNNLNSSEEKMKKKMAEKILKSDRQMKSIHSYQSIKKLLEREGLTNPSQLNSLRIAVLKERDATIKNEYQPNLLTHLRDLPII